MNNPGSLENELREAKAITRAAWERIAPYYGGRYAITEKSDGPVTEADHASSEYIIERLKRAFPDDAVLSEEDAGLAGTFQCERLWLVDPIDGTRDFIDGTGNFAIQIGLTARHAREYAVRLGVVYHPTENLLYFARQGGGAWVENAGGAPPRPMRVSSCDDPAQMTAVFTRSHRTSRFLEIMDRMAPRERMSMGSLGLKIVCVASGRADYYVNNSRGMCKEWDVCAPEAILAEAGGRITDLSGAPLRYNQPEARVTGGVFATNDRRHDALRRRFLEIESEVCARAET